MTARDTLSAAGAHPEAFHSVEAMDRERARLRKLCKQPVEEITTAQAFNQWVENQLMLALWEEYAIPLVGMDDNKALTIAEQIVTCQRWINNAGQGDHMVLEYGIWQGFKAEWDKLVSGRWSDSLSLFFVRRIQNDPAGKMDADFGSALMTAIETLLSPRYVNHFNKDHLKRLRTKYEGKRPLSYQGKLVVPLDLDGFCSDPEVVAAICTGQVIPDYPEQELRRKILGHNFQMFDQLMREIYQNQNDVPLPLTSEELERLVGVMLPGGDGAPNGGAGNRQGDAEEEEAIPTPLEQYQEVLKLRATRLQRVLMVRRKHWPDYDSTAVAATIERVTRRLNTQLPNLVSIRKKEVFETLGKKGQRNKLALALVFDSLEKAGLIPRDNPNVKDWSLKRSGLLKAMERVFAQKKIGHHLFYSLNEKLLHLMYHHQAGKPLEEGERAYKEDPLVAEIRLLLLIILEEAVRGTIQSTGTKKVVRFELFLEQTYMDIVGQPLPWSELIDPNLLARLLLEPLDLHRATFHKNNFISDMVWLNLPKQVFDFLRDNKLEGVAKQAFELALHANPLVRHRVEEFWREMERNALAEGRTLRELQNKHEETSGPRRQALVTILGELRGGFRTKDLFTGNTTGRIWFQTIFQGAFRRLAEPKLTENKAARFLVQQDQLDKLARIMEVTLFSPVASTEELARQRHAE